MPSTNPLYNPLRNAFIGDLAAARTYWRQMHARETPYALLLYDLGALATNNGTSLVAGSFAGDDVQPFAMISTAAAVPEPAIGALLISSIALLRPRRRRSN